MTNQIKTVLFLGLLTAIVAGVGSAIAPGQLPFFLGFALLMNVGAYFFSDKLVLTMHRARQVDVAEAPELYALLGELAGRAQLPLPKLYLIDSPQPNAFATGRSPSHSAVAVTTGILHLLDRRELRGVLAHELSHIKNRDILLSTIAAVLTSTISSIGHALQWSMLFGGGRSSDERGTGGTLLMIFVAPLAAMLVQLGISRSREYLADETGARISGEPEALASALRKLEQGVALMPSDAHPATASLFIMNPFGSAKSLLQLFSTHPPVEARIERLMTLATSMRNERDNPRLSTNNFAY